VAETEQPQPPISSCPRDRCGQIPMPAATPRPPLDELGRTVVRGTDRKGHISTLHLWWARRPLVAARAGGQRGEKKGRRLCSHT